MVEKGDEKKQLFHNGTYYKAYEYMGAHRQTDKNGKLYTVFRTWAPDADAVFVTGDFNDWSERHPMRRITPGGVWEVKIRLDFNNSDKLKYKYLIINGAKAVFKADPFAVYDETNGQTASYLYELEPFGWGDNAWLVSRKKAVSQPEKKPAYTMPINIYELHPGSFMRGEGGRYLTYRELADRIAPYVKRMGYTHIALLPVAEHQLDEIRGYRICGFYAPTSRFGTPSDFMYFVNKMHIYGIGVILEWVSSHFSDDEHGLYEFDGSPCYEYRDRRNAPGKRFFDVGRGEVRSFLISNALYWLDEYHIDGLYVGNITPMLYRDAGRSTADTALSYDGLNKSYEAIDFFKELNTAVFEKHGDVLMIAEERSSFPMLTKPVYMGGLGFSFKYNTAFTDSMMKYVSSDPERRVKEHKCLTEPLLHSFAENHILAITHDEVTDGKKSLLDKMYGDTDQKFDGMRTYLTYMMCHPGKKLLFMGCEYGQLKEWDCKGQLEWLTTGRQRHAEMLKFTSALNHFYLDTPALWEHDLSWEGFRWIKADDAGHSATVFARVCGNGDLIICAFNFSLSALDGYRIGVPAPGLYREVFGTRPYSSLPAPSENIRSDGFDQSIKIKLLPLSAAVYRCEGSI